MGWDVQAGEEAGDAAAGRRRAGVVPTSRARLPDANQPGSAEGDDRGAKEGAGVRISTADASFWSRFVPTEQCNILSAYVLFVDADDITRVWAWIGTRMGAASRTVRAGSP